MGDVGGFYASLDILVYIFGQFFSAKFFMASIANTFFVLLNSSHEEDDEDQTSPPKNSQFPEDESNTLGSAPKLKRSGMKTDSNLVD